MSWISVLMLAAARVTITLQLQTVGSLAADLEYHFSLDSANIGLLLGLYLAPGVLVALPAGYLGSFVSEKAAARLGFLSMTMGGLVFAIAPTANLLFVGRLVSGIGAISANLALTRAVAERFEGQRAPFAMAIFANSWPVGLALGAASIGPLARVSDWRWASGSVAIAAIVALLLCERVIRISPGIPLARRLPPPREAVAISLAGITWGLTNSVFIITVTFAPTMLKANGFGVAAAEGVTVAIIAIGAICVPLGGYLVHRGFNEARLVRGSLGCWFIVLILMAVLPSWFTLLTLITAALSALPAGALLALPGRLMGETSRAVGMGLFYTWFYALFGLLPWIAAAATDAHGPVGSWIVCAGYILIAVGTHKGADTRLRQNLVRRFHRSTPITPPLRLCRSRYGPRDPD